MLNGGDDLRKDVITLGKCFSMFVYTRARFRFALIGGNLTTQSTGSHRGMEWNSNCRDVLYSRPQFYEPLYSLTKSSV